MLRVESSPAVHGSPRLKVSFNGRRLIFDGIGGIQPRQWKLMLVSHGGVFEYDEGSGVPEGCWLFLHGQDTKEGTGPFIVVVASAEALWSGIDLLPRCTFWGVGGTYLLSPKGLKVVRKKRSTRTTTGSGTGHQRTPRLPPYCKRDRQDGKNLHRAA